MAFQHQGNSGNVDEVDLTHRASRVSMRPIDHGSGGMFRVSRRLVPASTTLTGNLWTFRNPSATLSAVLWVLRLRVLQVGAPTAAIEDFFTAKIARSYTLADTTGSVSIAPAATMQKVKTSMANSVMEIREANVAAGASGGTRTMDTDGFLTGSVWVLAALPSGGGGPNMIFEYAPDLARGEHPIVLVQNEGFIVANGNNFGAASGIILQLELAYSEQPNATI